MYTKTNWTETTPRSLANLNKMETQYDEAIADAIALRADNTKELKVQVAASAPAGGVAGQLYFNSAESQVYYHNGTDWVLLGVRLVKLVQKVTFNFSGFSTTSTITAVDVDNTIIIRPMSGYLSAVSAEKREVRATLSNSTTVLIERYSDSDSAIGACYVVEYYPGAVKSIQKGTENGVTSSGKTVTITAVDVNKSVVHISFKTDNANGSATGGLTSSTALELSTPVGVTADMAWYVVEYY